MLPTYGRITCGLGHTLAGTCALLAPTLLPSNRAAVRHSSLHILYRARSSTSLSRASVCVRTSWRWILCCAASQAHPFHYIFNQHCNALPWCRSRAFSSTTTISKRPTYRHNPLTPIFTQQYPPPYILPSTTGKVDSSPRSITSTFKSRAHSRLASLGWNRPRASVHQSPSQQKESEQSQPRSVSQSREQSPHSPALSPASSDASIVLSNGSSETSTLTNSSIETACSDASSNIKSGKEQAQQQCDTTEEHAKLILDKAHMMHQTSSRLLRMTGDDRPFTKVCLSHCYTDPLP